MFSRKEPKFLLEYLANDTDISACFSQLALSIFSKLNWKSFKLN